MKSYLGNRDLIFESNEGSDRRGFLKSLLVAPVALTPLAAKADPAVASYEKLAAGLKIDEQMGVVYPSSTDPIYVSVCSTANIDPRWITWKR